MARGTALCHTQQTQKRARAILSLRFSFLQKRSLLSVFLAHLCDFGLLLSYSTSATAFVESFLQVVSGMDFRRCLPPCSHLIASDDQHGKCVRCMGLDHARDAIFGISNCKSCENRESSVSSCRAAPEASSLREAAAWSTETELEAMESDQLNPLSFPSSPERRGAVSPVEFSCGCLAPTPEARNLVSFRMEDILFTAASDSEDFGADSLDALPPSELVDVLARATEKLSLDWSKLDERFLSGSESRPRAPSPRKRASW
ncbi:hypothetical protein QQF64_006925 [Cirrhinus molitorella]|uniref:Uncharacterized protein n=1 Tax=Cirrhinus molitorella TaxID=172907 RepID=A0ABR3M9X2_9TELE